MVRQFLLDQFGVGEGAATARFAAMIRKTSSSGSHAVRIYMELVLGTPAAHPPFTLIWRPWRRTSLASAESFRYWVLIGMTRFPLHARSVAVAQTILGSSCARVEVAPPEVTPADVDCEFFCCGMVHPPAANPRREDHDNSGAEGTGPRRTALPPCT